MTRSLPQTGHVLAFIPVPPSLSGHGRVGVLPS